MNTHFFTLLVLFLFTNTAFTQPYEQVILSENDGISPISMIDIDGKIFLNGHVISASNDFDYCTMALDENRQVSGSYRLGTDRREIARWDCIFDMQDSTIISAALSTFSSTDPLRDDLILVKADRDFNIIDTKIIGASGDDDEINSGFPTSDNGFLVLGSRNTTGGIVIKYDETLEQKWLAKFNGSQGEIYLTHGSEVNDGNYWLSGWSDRGRDRLYVVEMSSGGKVLNELEIWFDGLNVVRPRTFTLYDTDSNTIVFAARVTETSGSGEGIIAIGFDPDNESILWTKFWRVSDNTLFYFGEEISGGFVIGGYVGNPFSSTAVAIYSSFSGELIGIESESNPGHGSAYRDLIIHEETGDYVIANQLRDNDDNRTALIQYYEPHCFGNDDNLFEEFTPEPIIENVSYYTNESIGEMDNYLNARSFEPTTIIQDLKPAVSLGPDGELCEGDQNMLLLPEVSGSNLSYNWSDGTANSTLEINNPGIYSVTVTSGCYSAVDSISFECLQDSMECNTSFNPRQVCVIDPGRNIVPRNIKTFDGDIYLHGFYDSGAGDEDDFIIHFNDQGELINSTSYGSFAEEHALTSGLFKLSDGTIIACGHTEDMNSGGSNQDFAFVKLDENLNILDKITLGTSNGDEQPARFQKIFGDRILGLGGNFGVIGNGLVVSLNSTLDTEWALSGLPNGNLLYIVSATQLPDSTILLSSYHENSGSNSIYIHKINQNGDVIWEKSYNHVNYNPVNARPRMQYISPNNIVISYHTYGENDLPHLITFCIDENGNENWNKVFTSGNAPLPAQIYISSDNDLYIVGFTTEGAFNEAFIIRMRDNGTVLAAELATRENSNYRYWGISEICSNGECQFVLAAEHSNPEEYSKAEIAFFDQGCLPCNKSDFNISTTEITISDVTTLTSTTIPENVNNFIVGDFNPSISCTTSSLDSFSLGEDLNICSSTFPIQLSADIEMATTFLWSTGDTTADIQISEPGTYAVTISDGCLNSADTINVNATDADSVLLDITLCDGDSTEINNQIISSAGTYVQTFMNEEGCDSLIIINVELAESVEADIFETINNGQTIEINGISYDQAGNYMQILTGSNGCDSILNIEIKVRYDIVHYTLDACHAITNQTNNDYSEFQPAYPEILECGSTSAGIVFRQNPNVNWHSCTPGIDGQPAMCVSSLEDCNYVEDSEQAVRFDVTLNPEAGKAITLEGFNFYEKAPTNFEWIGGDSGPNNYPTLYGFRLLKDGTEIYRLTDIPTSNVWTKQIYDLTAIPECTITQLSTFTFELISYCRVGNGAAVAAWDVDEIRVQGSCGPVPDMLLDIRGLVQTPNGVGIEDVTMSRTIYDIEIATREEMTDVVGRYNFKDNPRFKEYEVWGNKNDDLLNGVTTYDLLLIQRYIVGFDLFATPYLYLAADINRDEAINVLDVVALRKAILGISNEFPNNESWIIIDKDRPPALTQPYTYSQIRWIPSLDHNLYNEHFVGVKIGDLNGDVKASSASAPFIEPQPYLDLEYIISSDNNGTTRIDFYTDQENVLSGLQTSLYVGRSDEIRVDDGQIDLSESNWRLDNDGNINISWTNPNGETVKFDDPLFTLHIRSKNDYRVNPSLTINEKWLTSEAYIGDQLMKYNLRLTPRIRIEKLSLSISPNPTSDRTTIEVRVPDRGQINMTIYDITGQEVLRNELIVPQGEHVWNLSARNQRMLPGTYYIQIVSGDDMLVKKLVIQ